MTTFWEFDGVSSSILLPPPDQLEIDPDVEQRVTIPTCPGLLDHEFLIQGSAIRIEFEVLLTREVIDNGVDKASVSRRVWKNLATLVPGGLEQRFRKREQFLVAFLNVDEFPVDWGFADDWLERLDSVDADCGSLAPMVESLHRKAKRDFWFSFTSGSLFHMRRLEVHPSFRGQQIGGRLLLHALAQVGRSIGDVAVLNAVPIRTLFENCPADQRAKAVRALVRYYRRIGFKRWGRGSIKDGDSVPMYARFGECLIKPQGLPKSAAS